MVYVLCVLQGTVDAVHYLASVVASGAPPRLHDMSDVLKAGPLRRGAAPGMSAQTGEGNGSINYVFA